MAEWLEQAPQWHEVCCHDLEVMSSNPGRVELGVLSTSVLSRTWTKNITKSLVVEDGHLRDMKCTKKIMLLWWMCRDYPWKNFISFCHYYSNKMLQLQLWAIGDCSKVTCSFLFDWLAVCCFLFYFFTLFIFLFIFLFFGGDVFFCFGGGVLFVCFFLGGGSEKG